MSGFDGKGMDNSETKERRRFLEKILLLFLMSFVLLLFSLAKVGLGLDFADTGYSLGNYLYPEKLQDMWFCSTFLANLTGIGLVHLPFGNTLLGIRIYCGLLLSSISILSFFFCILKLKLHPWLTFLGELIALGFCWCPIVILYNYLTYLFIVLLQIFLFSGLTSKSGKKKTFWLLFAAGVFYGCSILVRFPNLTQGIFILAPIGYAFLNAKGNGEMGASKNIRVFSAIKTALFYLLACTAGFACGFGILFCALSYLRGGSAYFSMIASLFSVSSSAEGYAMTDMLKAIPMAFFQEAYYLKYLFLLLAFGVVFDFLCRKTSSYLGYRIVYFYASICIGVFYFLYRRNFFNLSFENTGSFYNPGVVFVLAGLCVCLGSLLFSVSSEKKLFSFLMLLTVLVVPLGSNNGLYPLLNCLFLFAPYSLDGLLMMGFRDSENRKERGVFVQYLTHSEALRVFGWCFTGLLLLISLGNGFFYVFGDAPRKQLSARLTGEPVSGVFTTQEKAELFTKIREKAAASGAAEILIYGDMPGLSYYLKLPPAIDTTWPNLASYPAISFQRQLSEIEKKASGWPLVVVAPCNEENPEKEKALEAFLVGHYREEASFSTAEGEVRMFFLVDISKE